MVVFRAFQLLVLRWEVSLGLPVLLMRVLHLLVDRFALVRVGVRRGGHGGDRVRRGRLALSGEHLAHHFYVDRLILPISCLNLRVCCLEGHGCGRRRHTWRKRVKGQLGAGASFGL